MTPVAAVTAAATAAVERLPLPDGITRAGIAALVGRTARQLRRLPATLEQDFARTMGAHPIAVATAEANQQHYEVPSAFFTTVLGPRRKYSCCLYPDAAATLAEAEEHALAETAAHANLADGQHILELGCGWGSLSLWMADRFPAARITAVSNSRTQRAHIEAEAERRGLSNLRVIMADMNAFEPEGRFDRVVSVEMFEHMSNWEALLRRIHAWLKPDGALFLHVFSHVTQPYRFDTADRSDWIAQYFFTGGIMPSHNMIRHIDAPFAVEADWRWSGLHYARTAGDWLARFDANAAQVERVLRATYGAEWQLWRRRWRLFFLATAGLFGAEGGETWGVSHYRLRPA